MFVFVDRKGGKALDAGFRAEMLRHLERFRLAGHDLDLGQPIYVPLDVALSVCVARGYFASAVARSLRERLSTGENQRGERGFFHPDHFSFGQGLPLSRLLEAVMSVAGVASVKVELFQRWGKVANQERERGLISAAALEILRLDDDPNFPENGRLVLNMEGGA